MKGDLAMYDRFGTTDPANDSHSIQRSDLPLTRRSALLLGAAVGMGAAASLGAGRAGAGPARATPLVVDVDRGNVQPIPIALPDFLPGGPSDSEPARLMSQVITNNLRRSGLFAPIDPSAFIERVTSTDVPPRFPDWQAIKAQELVVGRVTRQPDGRVKVEFRLWDVFGGQQLS